MDSDPADPNSIEESNYLQLVSNVIGNKYGKHDHFIHFDNLGLLTNNKTRFSAGELINGKMFPLESEIAESLTIASNAVPKVGSDKAAEAITGYLLSKVNKVLKFHREGNGDGSIFDDHILNKGKGQLVYKTPTQLIPFKDCFVLLERYDCIEKMTKNGTTVFSSNFIYSQSKKASLASLKIKRKIKSRKTCTPQEQQQSVIVEKSSKLFPLFSPNVNDMKKVPVDNDTTAAQNCAKIRSSVRSVDKKTKIINKSARKLEFEENIFSIPVNKLETHLRKKLKRSKSNTVQMIDSVNNENHLNSDSDKENNDKENSQQRKPARLSRFLTRKRSPFKPLDIRCLQFPLTQDSNIQTDFHPQDSAKSKNRFQQFSDPEVETKANETIKLDLSMDLEVSTVIFQPNIENLSEVEPNVDNTENVSPPKPFVPLLPPVMKTLGRYSSIYNTRNIIDNVFNQQKDKLSSGDLQKYFAPSEDEKYLRVRITKNDEPVAGINNRGLKFIREVEEYKTSIKSEVKSEPSSKSPSSHARTVDLFQELPGRYSGDSSFEDDTHSKFPYASTKAPADASQKEDEALGQILDDVLDMQAETEFYYDNVERIINELSRIEFLPWDLLNPTLTTMISSEDFEVLLNDFDVEVDSLFLIQQT